jgi:hypothetical protein
LKYDDGSIANTLAIRNKIVPMKFMKVAASQSAVTVSHNRLKDPV